MSRSLGVDFGGKWFGLALSDPSGRIARPLEVVEGQERALLRMERLVAEEGVEAVVVGLPRNMDGSLGPKAREVLRFVETVRTRLPVPVDTWDERLTTLEAERYLAEAGVPRRRWAERVNQVAAQILLQSWLDRSQSSGPEEDAAPGAEGPEDSGVVEE
jgi:putative Holliday junction resolvase